MTQTKYYYVTFYSEKICDYEVQTYNAQFHRHIFTYNLSAYNNNLHFSISVNNLASKKKIDFKIIDNTNLEKNLEYFIIIS